MRLGAYCLFLEKSSYINRDVHGCTIAVPRGYVIGSNQTLSHKILGVLPIKTCFLCQRSCDKNVFLAFFGETDFLLFIGIVFVKAPSSLSAERKTNSKHGTW